MANLTQMDASLSRIDGYLNGRNGQGRRNAESWADYQSLPEGLSPVPAFDYDLLPPILGSWIEDIAERMQCPADYPAVGAIVSLASLVGTRAVIRPKRADDWKVTPNLWGMAVGSPGILKTPSLEEAKRVLQVQAIEEFRNSCTEYAASQLISGEVEKVARGKINSLLKTGSAEAARDLARQTVEEEQAKPTCRRYIVNDTTVEKLGELLNENPQGLLLYRDELPGFFRTLERAGREGDRAFYLECWNGDGSFTYDRIGRGTLHIDRACVSILGSIQPGPLSGLVRALHGGGDDGLLQRFQLAVYPDASREWRNVDRRPNVELREQVGQIFRRLNALPIGGDPQEFRFSDAAQSLFEVWREILESRLRDESLPGIMESHLAKYRSLVPALALLLHLVESDTDSVEVTALERAIAWAEYLEPHARRIYAPALSRDMDSARELGRHLKARDVGTQFSLRDVYNNGWTSLSTRDEAAAAVAVLEDYGWLVGRTEQTQGRPRTVYAVNPAAMEKG